MGCSIRRILDCEKLSCLLVYWAKWVAIQAARTGYLLKSDEASKCLQTEFALVGPRLW